MSGVFLTSAEVQTVIEALDDAANAAADRGTVQCADCSAAWGGLCYDHAGDYEIAVMFSTLADKLRGRAR